MKFGVVTFPGSNCDQDMVYVLKDLMGQEVVELWHKIPTSKVPISSLSPVASLMATTSAQVQLPNFLLLWNPSLHTPTTAATLWAFAMVFKF